ncbi:MAG: IclR family transcriptional regulator C-terminal domain-containing protein [Sphingomonadaceae bacterium]
MTKTANIQSAGSGDAAKPEGRYLQSVDRMGGFAKGLSVIEAFGQKRSQMTIAEVARLSGLDRASARRCLLTLVEAGYATTDGRYFELTPRVLRLAHSYLSAPLPRLIQPTLDQLADRLQESCSAAVLDSAEVVYIGRGAHHRIVGPGLHAGSRLPAFCTSLGRVLLAALPPEQAESILKNSERPAITSYTLTEVPDLMAELNRVRIDGYAIIDQEMEVGSRSIAVPIVNIAGQTIAAITVGVHAVRAEITRLKEEILPALLDAKEQLRAIIP